MTTIATYRSQNIQRCTPGFIIISVPVKATKGPYKLVKNSQVLKGVQGVENAGFKCRQGIQAQVPEQYFACNIVEQFQAKNREGRDGVKAFPSL